jgi:CD63 antigen
MGCATGVVKYFVFLANLIFVLAGLALVIIGILFKFHYSEATDALPANFGVAPILSIIIGAIVFVTAFCGCCGAVKESPCMLTTYAIILLVIFIVQVAIGVYAFIKINQDEQGFRRSVHDTLAKTFEGYGRNNEKTESVDAMQSWLQCCGLDQYNSMALQNGDYPRSCCREGVNTCRSTDYTNFYNTPCMQATHQFLQKSSNVIGGVAIGIAVIEILGAVFGLCLSSSIRNHYRRNIYA